ncbi:MAG: cobalt-precorrin-5B (C(1))-methyltransferase [Nitrospirota bacterium]
MPETSRRGTRTGFSTGACATAATKAAMSVLLGGPVPERVMVSLPVGDMISFAIAECVPGDGEVMCGVVKDAGDDPDVTNRAVIRSTVSWLQEPGVIRLEAGDGVGVVTKPGLGIDVGQPDITRVPRKMITEAVSDAAAGALHARGVRVVLSVPGGQELAKKTELARLGVVGGVAILGTTGIVRPYSTSAFRAGISIAVGMAATNGARHLVATTGGMSERFAKKLLDLPEEAFIQMGDFVGFALQEAVKRRIERVTISGMIGKLSKMAKGTMQTHAAGSEVDTEFLAALAAECGAGAEALAAIRSANTARHVAELIVQYGVPGFFDRLAERVCTAAVRHAKGVLSVECLLTDFEGRLVGKASAERTP